MRRYRNACYAPESLGRKLNPSAVVIGPPAVVLIDDSRMDTRTDCSPDYTSNVDANFDGPNFNDFALADTELPPIPGEGPQPTDFPPSPDTGPVLPAFV